MRVLCAVFFVMLASVPAQDAKREIVHVVGEAKATFVIVTPEMSLLDAMERAAPTLSAALDRVVLVRAGAGVRAMTIDFRHMVLTGDCAGNVVLNPDDWLVLLPKANAEPSPATEEAFDAVLRSSAPEAIKATILVHRLLHARDAGIRARAALDMGALRETATLVVEPLMTALKDTVAVQREAIVVLGMLGAKAAAARDALEALTHDGDAQVARRAKAALATVRAAVAAKQPSSRPAAESGASCPAAPTSRPQR